MYVCVFPNSNEGLFWQKDYICHHDGEPVGQKISSADGITAEEVAGEHCPIILDVFEEAL